MNHDLIWAAVRLLVFLPLVLGLAYLVLKYGLARRYAVKPGTRHMRLVEQLSLGPKTGLSLVELGGRYYLMAHQENSVQLIKELDALPDPKDLKTGDILELNPKTVADLDRMRKSGAASVTENFYGIREGWFKERVKALTGKALKVQASWQAKFFAGRRKETGDETKSKS
ncbi:MAG: Flagellar biogenesis protein [Pelotomaculum thermopropionicum]|uniref:Flagellar protein n=1 Tax=Pelotomaculum thermopropionicum TaxID=110500 RepID=A0A101HQT4_9FIRM|nr:MAG: Flagellar biogenesis protein [Pelotomaculum thermopropionicum]